MTQREALTILKTGRNVFLTGAAGSGKTYVLNEYIKYLKSHEVPIGITASTGIAATHMGGSTIHSWTGIGVKDRLGINDIAEIATRSQVRRKMEEAKVLIIDEVSMLHHFRLDMVDAVLRHVRKSDQPFGGLQVVLCGDFFQLPPVSRMGEQEAHFVYDSQAWKDGAFTTCYLSEQHRQNDDQALSILNEIRSGEVSESSINLLMSRHVGRLNKNLKSTNNNFRTPDVEDVTEPTNQEKSIGVEPARLFTHNVDVDTLNDRELSRVSGIEVTYEMVSHGRKPLVEVLKKSCLAPSILRLKKGARVMCVKNNYEEGYVNGTLGIVVSCAHGSDPIIRTAATPEYPQGRQITMSRESWTIEDDGKVLAEISQYPLRLAWAITVHKSQGMSLDAAEVDLSKSFEPGMGYVALSRVRSLQGLTILGLNGNALKVHPEVLEYDRHLRQSSDEAERWIEATDAHDIERMQAEFLAAIAPLHKKGKGGARVKEKKISTFEKTLVLVRQNLSLAEMAEKRGVIKDTIVAQIERLIEGGKGTGDGLNVQDILYLKKEVSPNHLLKLERALEDVATKTAVDEMPTLSEVKSIVGVNISWLEIRLARVIFGYVTKKK